MADRTSDTQSVLAALTSGIMTRKANKGAKLTPTATESTKANVLAGFGVAFPYDSPETMIAALRTALDELDHVRKGIVTILAALGGEPGPAEAEVDPLHVIKAREKAADAAAFEREYKAQQKAAQAATFQTADSTVEGGEDPTPSKADRIAAMKAELAALNEGAV